MWSQFWSVPCLMILGYWHCQAISGQLICHFLELIGPWEIWLPFLKKSIFNLVSLTGKCKTSYANTPRWMSRDLIDGKSTLVQVMAWCRQARSHYLSQCWSRSMSPNGVTRPQWVNYFSSWKCYVDERHVKLSSRTLEDSDQQFRVSLKVPWKRNHHCQIYWGATCILALLFISRLAWIIMWLQL